VYKRQLLAIVVLFAIPFGYFLHKAIIHSEWEDLLVEIERLKNKVFEQSQVITQLQEKSSQYKSEEEKLRKDFYQLTMAYKSLEERSIEKEKEELVKDYEVPPQVKHLEEANDILNKEIQRLKVKASKANNKELKKLNKELQRKLDRSLIKIKKIKAKRPGTSKYKKFYKEYQRFKVKADQLVLGPTPKKKKEKKNRNKIKQQESNFFKHQPPSKKNAILEQITGNQNIHSSSENPPVAFDLEKTDYSLRDLVGINHKIEAALKKHGILSFKDLTKKPISELKEILEQESLSTKNKRYESWPIQARLALNGEWDLIKEYKKK